MAKLPTAFTTLELQGFDIEQKQQHTAITREMIDVACAVLQKNRLGIVSRSVQSALKHIYGIGGSTDVICQLLREWRAENLASLKQGRSEKDLASTILEATNDGLLEESDIPEEYLAVMRQMAIAGYQLAYQKADTSVSGDRMKMLSQENAAMQQQLKDFPQLEVQLSFYKSEYERQRTELREAYMNLNKQQLADSDTFRQQLENLGTERNDLRTSLLIAEGKLAELGSLELKERDRTLELARINGQLEQKQVEISGLHGEIQSLQTVVGAKSAIESQLVTLKAQLKEANETITRLQSQQKATSALEVDVDVDSLQTANESLAAEVSNLQAQLQEFQSGSGKKSKAVANSK
ncbi:hypothetical protein [Microcoleus sp. bin38.metabat.b11b12b14.051]|uniref:hypothetical protein n=1 Tax=Microcoleus sp. bin38.metabat.b11b12b14.051 TaxID=2742709 RepID=UPI0025E7578D|nr:hypothetical protein [Microcoleus sp. bin38.metabat.b11b12b14.051]